MDNYVPEFMRIMTTNLISSNGIEWVNNYKSWKDHMYITQWIVLDFAVLDSINNSQHSHPGLIHIVEEVPGSILSRDITDVLFKESYFGSFNVAYFKENFSILGMDSFPIDLISQRLF
jgi:hypothetical protein